MTTEEQAVIDAARAYAKARTDGTVLYSLRDYADEIDRAVKELDKLHYTVTIDIHVRATDPHDAENEVHFLLTHIGVKYDIV